MLADSVRFPFPPVRVCVCVLLRVRARSRLTPNIKSINVFIRRSFKVVCHALACLNRVKVQYSELVFAYTMINASMDLFWHSFC